MYYDLWLKQIKYKLKDNSGSNVVGVFDSGIGGLTVLPNLLSENHGLKVNYLGDTAHFPYGNKSESLITVLILSRITDLLNTGAEYIAIACNTASIAFAKICNDNYINSKIIGTIDCTSEFVAQKTSSKYIGVIGTKYTINSKAYEIAFKKRPKSKIFVLQSTEQKLVQGIENADFKLIQSEAQRITKFFNSKSIDTFILGCTHYAHIKQTFLDMFEENICIIDPSTLLGEKLRSLYNPIHKRPNNLKVYFTGAKPNLSGLFREYAAYVQSSQPNTLPFDQLGLYNAIKQSI